MLKIETKELIMSDKLKKKVDMICKFACVKPTYHNGNIINIVNSNIAYVKPHIVTINNIDYLMFDECDDIYINGYSKKIQFKDLEENHETIRELLNENEDLNVKLEEKERLLQVSKNTISDLKKKIFNLEEQVNYWKNKFTKIVSYIKDKVLGLFGKDEERIYRNIANDLFMNNKVSYEDYENMLGRNSKNKNSDDLEI